MEVGETVLRKKKKDLNEKILKNESNKKRIKKMHSKKIDRLTKEFRTKERSAGGKSGTL